MRPTRRPSRRAKATTTESATDAAPSAIPAADRFRFSDMVAEATADIGSRPVRLVMTILGTVLGVGALVATIGFSQTTSEQVARQFDAVAATQLVASPAKTEGPDGESVATTRLPWDAVARVSTLAGVRDAAVVAEVPLGEAGEISAVAVDDPSAAAVKPPPLVAASSGLLDTIRGSVISGRAFDDGHSRRADRVALLGARAAARLGISDVGSQPSIFVDGIAYSVIGVFDGVRSRTELLDAVVIPTATARRDFRLAGPGELQVRIAVGTGAQLDEQAALALAPDHPDQVDVAAPSSRSSLGSRVQSDINVVFLLLAVVVLLGGGVGIANVTLLSVMERIGEIGLRRALGATRRQIAGQFVTESVVIGVLGGLIGASLGVLSVVVFSAVQHWSPVIDPLVALGGSAIGAVVGLGAGWVPARRAALIEPVSALRGS